MVKAKPKFFNSFYAATMLFNLGRCTCYGYMLYLIVNSVLTR